MGANPPRLRRDGKESGNFPLGIFPFPSRFPACMAMARAQSSYPSVTQPVFSRRLVNPTFNPFHQLSRKKTFRVIEAAVRSET